MCNNAVDSFSFVERLIQETPGSVRFFLLSRTQPGMNLQQLKIKQGLIAINNEDLAFTLDETLSFFKNKSWCAHGKHVMGQKEIEKILSLARNKIAKDLEIIDEKNFMQTLINLNENN